MSEIENMQTGIQSDHTGISQWSNQVSIQEGIIFY